MLPQTTLGPDGIPCLQPILPERDKELGAYYTDRSVAAFLLRWAVRTGRETVLDPASGGGAFLNAAAERINALGGEPGCQIHGVEIDGAVHRAFTWQRPHGLAPAKLLHRDFFEVRLGDLPPVDAVVGNPPFIRYHRFTGEQRQLALQRAREADVRLSRLTSSWAPFLIHAAQFIKPGGRLAVVAPAELAHAAYARPVLQYLCEQFRSIRLVTFARRIFTGLSEDTLLVLAEDRAAPVESLTLIDLPDLQALTAYHDPVSELPKGIPVDHRALVAGRERLLHYLLPKATLALYRQLARSPGVVRLGELADVGIGYVTGDNDFFHVDKRVVATYGFPETFLRRAMRRGAELRGLQVTAADWNVLHELGQANLLLAIPPDAAIPPSVQAYLDTGLARGVPDRYKCAVREPWYSVPHVHDADGFLTYMSGRTPKLVANAASAVAPNTLHLVRLHPRGPLDIVTLAAFWQTDFTVLSAELAGHSLGGGLLKLEPTEARQVLLATPPLAPNVLQELGTELDALLRAGRLLQARARVDAVVLRTGLGLAASDVHALRDGWQLLQARRHQR